MILLLFWTAMTRHVGSGQIQMVNIPTPPGILLSLSLYIYIYMNTCKTCAISLKITCKAFLLCHTMIMSQSYTSWENNLIFFNVKTIVELVFLHLNWFKYFSVLSWGKLYRSILLSFHRTTIVFFFF